MAPKKAAKQAPKKAAKKAPAKKAGNDVRRAYEHLGRVGVLSGQLTEEDGRDLRVLVTHAENALGDGDDKSAADLLRAAEHLAFGTLATGAEPDESSTAALLDSVHEELGRLRERAQENGEAAEAARPVGAIYKRMVKTGAAAVKAKRYRAALELYRGAEALTHVRVSEMRLAGSDRVGSLIRGK